MDNLGRKLRQVGARYLTNYELLTIISPNTTTQGEIAVHDIGKIVNMSVDELEEVGIDTGTAVSLLASIELGRRSLVVYAWSKSIDSPQSAADLLFPLIGSLDHEELVVLCLNTRNELVHVQHLYRGSVNSSVVRVAEVLRPAIVRNCPAIIIAHNHPSGDPAPSPEDTHVTRQIVGASRIFDIDILDHIVIGSYPRFVSMKERGLGFD